MDPTLLATLLILVLCVLGLSWFAGSDAPYVPTTTQNLSKVLKKILKKEALFYELGSGDGRVVLLAAKMGARAIGIEQSWLRVWYSRYKAWRSNLKNVIFFHGNIFDRNYFPADVIYIYLLTPAVLKLEKKLQIELKKGSLVITQTYHFKNWAPIKKDGNFWIYQQK